MMESARQELQGRREYMSNDEIKRLTESIKCHGSSWPFVDHPWFHLRLEGGLRVQSHTAWDH